jgi:hypothetical protein
VSATLPDKEFSSAEVPADVRRWYDVALLRPLNELRRALVASHSKGLGFANLNQQLLGPKRITSDGSGAVPVLTFPSRLSGRCLGITLLRAAELDSSGKETTNTLGTWGAVPTWEEKNGVFRLLSQTGPAASKVYNVTWLAYGE